MNATAVKQARKKKEESMATKDKLPQIIATRKQIAETIIQNLDEFHRPYKVVTADEYGRQDLINGGDPLLLTYLLEAFARGEFPVGYFVADDEGKLCGVVLPPYAHIQKLQNFIRK